MSTNWAIDKLIAIPPTNGIAPLCRFRWQGLSTKPTAIATFRITKSDEKEKKPTNDSSNNIVNTSISVNGVRTYAIDKIVNIIFSWLFFVRFCERVLHF